MALELRLIVDDGAVVYLNGIEIGRLRMPTGAVDFTTQATTTPAVVEPHVLLGPFDVPQGALRSGDNVVAVEVHQNGTASNDIVIGADISLAASSSTPLAPPPAGQGNLPTLAIAKQGSNFVISWSGTGLILQQTSNLGSGSIWTPVANASNPYMVPPSGAKVFYRLRQ